MKRAGDRYSPGCLLERRQQGVTLHGMRCGYGSSRNIHTIHNWFIYGFFLMEKLVILEGIVVIGMPHHSNGPSG
ncbi:hypothetical protein Y032_1151g3695 [Ancylostoma ceylanicum]|uniref:Uncharacterized protein n=1 Tax=Ancylostoma ceylanicum TaxID=53326 RepID=A0A016W7Z2_9BILA|nr:hypothetical protein Y032_1151g3695 [Ancylostoma ceylanicum]